MRFRQAAAGALLAVICCGGAQAEFPDRPIRLVVPFAPGGANDSVARLISDRLSKILGQPMVVENRPGGGTLVGTNSVATAAPDGSTLLLISPAHTINPYINKNLPYRTLEDFTPIGQITRAAYVMVTAAASPFKTIRDFAKPDHPSVTFASAGAGSAPHLAAQLFVSSLGVNYVHVPYQGGAPALTATLGGHTPLVYGNVSEIGAHARSGKLRPLVLSTRAPSLPDVPTFAESGFPQLEASNWSGMVVPAATPAEIVAQLNAPLVRALAEPDVVEKFRSYDFIPMPGTPEQFEAFLRSESARYAKVIREAGIKSE